MSTIILGAQSISLSAAKHGLADKSSNRSQTLTNGKYTAVYEQLGQPCQYLDKTQKAREPKETHKGTYGGWKNLDLDYR